MGKLFSTRDISQNKLMIRDNEGWEWFEINHIGNIPDTNKKNYDDLIQRMLHGLNHTGGTTTTEVIKDIVVLRELRQCLSNNHPLYDKLSTYLDAQIKKAESNIPF